jgi:hypothetical protein
MKNYLLLSEHINKTSLKKIVCNSRFMMATLWLLSPVCLRSRPALNTATARNLNALFIGMGRIVFHCRLPARSLVRPGHNRQN